MTKRKVDASRSIAQRVANRGRQRGLSREDAFTAYAMDRILYRLGQSDQASEFSLKGGVLVANLLDAPFRFTRDIDVLRRRGPSDPDDLRARFERVVLRDVGDGLEFDKISAVRAERDIDGYDGVKVRAHGRLGQHPVTVQIDVGFGDATFPNPARVVITPFLLEDEPARVVAYDAHTVMAEKIETLMSRFPVIRHRLKDLLDVVTLARSLPLDPLTLRGSVAATVARRGAPLEPAVLDEMTGEISGRVWERDWATMLREKAVEQKLPLAEAVHAFVEICRPLFVGLGEG